MTDTPMQRAKRDKQKISDAISSWYHDLTYHANQAELDKVVLLVLTPLLSTALQKMLELSFVGKLLYLEDRVTNHTW